MDCARILVRAMQKMQQQIEKYAAARNATRSPDWWTTLIGRCFPVTVQINGRGIRWNIPSGTILYYPQEYSDDDTMYIDAEDWTVPRAFNIYA